MMKYLHKKAILLSILFLPFYGNILFGQRFEHLTTNEGLSQNSVQSIFQDSRGFMWFGTADGLNKFDGYSFSSYKHDLNDSNSISHNSIRCIFEDSKGLLWIGTENGLNYYDISNYRFESFKNDPENEHSISHNLIYSICEDDTGNIWIGTRGGGLNKFNPETGQFTRFTYESELFNDFKSKYIFQIKTDLEKKILYIATEGGLQFFDLQEEEFVIPENKPEFGFPSDIITTCLLWDNNKNNFWVGSWGHGLFKTNQKFEVIRQFRHDPGDPESIPDDIITSIAEDNQSSIWIGTRNSGIGKFTEKSSGFKTYQEDFLSFSSLNDNLVWTIYTNSQGIIWIGTGNGGVNKLNINQKKFNTHRMIPNSKNSIQDNTITDIYVDKEENLWIGTQNKGISVYNRQKNSYRHYQHIPENSNSLSSNSIKQIIEDRNGMFWIATDGGGISRYDPVAGKFKNYSKEENEPNSLSNEYAHCLLEDKNGYIWIGTWGGDERRGGIDIFNPKTEIFYNIPTRALYSSGISKNIVTTMIQDKDGIIWAGTRGEGLNKIFPQKPPLRYPYIDSVVVFKRINGQKNKLPNNDIYSLFQDSEGTLWIGTGGGGLSKYNPSDKTFTSYDKNNGLINSTIHYILEDNNKNLWFSTNRGISKFNMHTSKVKYYDVFDGLQDNLFLTGSGHKDRSGEMFFGGINGYTSFYPDSILHNRHIPPVVITKLRIFNKEIKGTFEGKKIYENNISETKKIVLPYKFNFFAIEFAALDYAVPHKNRYKYKLSGFNDDWIETSADSRMATYTNLNPGEYIFELIASNNDDIWNYQPTKLEIIITPPFYKALWFKIFVLFILGLVVFYLFNNLIKAFQKEKREIQRKAEESLFSERNQLRTLIDNLPDFIYIKDRESRFVVINKSLAKVMGSKEPDELVGTTDFDFYEKSMAQKYYHDEQEVMRSGEPLINIEEPGLNEFQQVRYILTTKIPLRNKKNKIVGLVGIGKDITELRETQNKLIEQSEYLKEINVLLEERQEEISRQTEELHNLAETLGKSNKELEKLSLVASKTDNSVAIIQEDGIVEWVNEGFYKIYKYKPEEIIGKHVVYDLGKYFSAALEKNFNKCLQLKQFVSYESDCINKEGKKFWLQTTLTPIVINNKVKRIIAIESDITELKNAEEEIAMQRDELKKLNLTKDKFFSIIAHDLKNPFHAIIGFTDLLNQNFNSIGDKEKKELIELINTTTKSTYALLENLLNWARAQTNTIKFKKSNINLTNIIRDNIRFLQITANKKDIALSADLKEDINVYADYNMINTIVRNLISNAIKFTGSKGKVHISYSETDTEYAIHISDDGVGMEKTTLENLFKIEEYRSTPGTSGESGTGLGLIICKDFISKNNGSISVKSEINKGSTFTFTLHKALPEK